MSIALWYCSAGEYIANFRSFTNFFLSSFVNNRSKMLQILTSKEKIEQLKNLTKPRVGIFTHR